MLERIYARFSTPTSTCERKFLGTSFFNLAYYRNLDPDKPGGCLHVYGVNRGGKRRLRSQRTQITPFLRLQRHEERDMLTQDNEEYNL